MTRARALFVADAPVAPFEGLQADDQSLTLAQETLRHIGVCGMEILLGINLLYDRFGDFGCNTTVSMPHPQSDATLAIAA